jgi:hypothetical protein
MDNERKIQMVRMGKESIMTRPGYKLSIDWLDEWGFYKAVERDSGGNVTKEIWLGPGAFISWKEQ